MRLKESIPSSYFIEGMNVKVAVKTLERSILNLKDAPVVKARYH